VFHNKLWINKEAPDSEADRISRETCISRLTAKVLINRGITSADEIRNFLTPSLDGMHDPFLLKDMDKAVKRIISALNSGESIMLYGDYDVDGVTSISILLDYLKNLGGNVDYYIPDRIDEGYGLSLSAMEKIIKMGKSLIITADCGITSIEEVKLAARHNVDVIITDHHECKSHIPDAYAVIDPCRHDCGYPFKELAGVGVVYKLINAISIKMGLDDHSYQRYIDLVAIGTVADVAPLVGENRTIVKYGIPKIENTLNKGLRALIGEAGLTDRPINSYSIGFILAPRINAAGRIGDAGRAVRLFTSNDEAETREIAAMLNQENQLRQDTEMEILQEALVRIESEVDFEKEKVMVVAGEHWHHGVIGITASRITEKYYRPCILISIEGDTGKGSGRSIKGFNLFDALTHCESLIDKYGGHELAAGLAIKTGNLKEFKNMINSYADSVLSQDDLLPRLRIDAYIEKNDICLENVRELEKLAPFGAGNPGPLFAYNNLRVVGIRAVGDSKHLKLKLETEGLLLDAIGFNMGSFADVIDCGDVLDAVFSLEINSWNFRHRIQLNIKDIRFIEK
jgi:single-stranded-DNA-specific exonuclease